MNTKQKYDTQKATILASKLLTADVLLCYLPLSVVSFLSNKHCYLPKNNQFRRSLLRFYCEIISPKRQPGFAQNISYSNEDRTNHASVKEESSISMGGSLFQRYYPVQKNSVRRK